MKKIGNLLVVAGFVYLLSRWFYWGNFFGGGGFGGKGAGRSF